MTSSQHLEITNSLSVNAKKGRSSAVLFGVLQGAAGVQDCLFLHKFPTAQVLSSFPLLNASRLLEAK